MKQIYFHYKYWEDFINGMYDTGLDNEEQSVNNSIILLSDCKTFLEIGKKILVEWPISCDVNLSNVHCNRCAWIGQACCSYLHGCTETITRIAWGQLGSETRNKANAVARKIITSYEEKNRRIYQSMGRKMLQGRNPRRSAGKISATQKSTFLQTDLFGNIIE